MFLFRKRPEGSPELPEIESGNIDSYIRNRLDEQIKWYDQKSQEAQRIYRRMQVVELIIAALIPLLSSYTVGHSKIAFAVGALGAVIAIIEGIERLYHYHENWIEYRAVCETLKHEKNLYLMNAFPYGADESKEQLFVHNVEDLISSEGSKWKSANTKLVAVKEQGHSETGS